jgi:hypothetical protein
MQHMETVELNVVTAAVLAEIASMPQAMQLTSRQSGIERHSRRCVELASSLRRGGPGASIALNRAKERSTNLGRDNSLSEPAPEHAT